MRVHNDARGELGYGSCQWNRLAGGNRDSHWWRGTLGIDFSVLEITNAGTVERPGKQAIMLVRKKFGVRSSDGVDNKVSGRGY